MDDFDTVLIESSRLMKQGISLVEADPGAALDCFDRALALRQRLPIDQVPVLRYDLTACWLNRGDALLRIGNHQGAIESYDAAIALLRTLPLDEDPRFVRRLALACHNRGRLLTLRADGSNPSPSDTREALAAFVEAIGVLEQHGAALPDRQQMLATIWMNTANAWLTDDHADAVTQATRAARLAIALVEDSEHRDPDAAEITLNARHILCRILAATPLTGDDIHDATDLADDALALIEHWERQGIPRFRPLAADLFRFGAHVYATHQPAFLQEYLQEHLDPGRSSRDYIDSAEMSHAAQDTSTLQPVTYYVRLDVQID